MELENEKMFEELVKSNKEVLVDLYATWCGPCKMLAPVLHEVEKEHENVTLVSVDVDLFPSIASRFDCMSIPTVIRFKDGQEVGKFVGYRSKEQVEEFIK